MINAGAILVCALLKTLDKPEMTLAEKFDYVMSFFSRLAGNEVVGFNNAVFLSEREAADRNYALGFYMREYKCYPEKTNLRECMDFYFQVTYISFFHYYNFLHFFPFNIWGVIVFSAVLWKPIVKLCQLWLQH